MRGQAGSPNCRWLPPARKQWMRCPFETIAKASTLHGPSLDHAEQAVGAHLRDRYRCNLPDKALRSHHLDRLEIWGATDNLARMASRFFEQDVKGTAQTSGVESSGMAIDLGL